MNTFLCFFGIESKQGSGPQNMRCSSWAIPKWDTNLCWQDAGRVLRGCCLSLEAPRLQQGRKWEGRRFWHPDSMQAVMLAQLQALVSGAMRTEWM